MRTKVAYLVETKKIEIREADLFPGDDQVLVKVKACGLCPWELNHWMGRKGFNITIGHEGAGIVAAVGKNVIAFKEGDAVTGSVGGHAEYVVANTEYLYHLSKNIPYEYGFSEPLKCVTTVLRNTAPAFGEIGVIVGCGPMGLWCMQALQGKMLSNLIAIDVNPRNLELARKYGASHTINPANDDVIAMIRDITNGRMADFVIEGTGNLNIFADAIKYVRKFGRIIVMSSYEHPMSNFDFMPAIERGVNIIVAHGSTKPKEDWSTAANMLNAGVFCSQDLVTHRYKLEDINNAFQSVEHRPKDYIKGIVVPE